VKGIQGTHSHKGGQGSRARHGKTTPTDGGRMGPIPNTSSHQHKTRTQTKLRPNKGAPK
jgi:hypothetical protein